MSVGGMRSSTELTKPKPERTAHPFAEEEMMGEECGAGRAQNERRLVVIRVIGMRELRDQLATAARCS